MQYLHSLQPDVWLDLWQGLALGLGSGAVYFGGLWLTVRALPNAERPHFLLFASYLGRIAVALAGFRLLIGYGEYSLLAGISGFFLARWLLVRRLRPLERNTGRAG